MKRCCFLVFLSMMLTHAGCATHRGGSAVANPETRKTLTVALHDRADRFWQAKLTEDWNEVFEFYEPDTRITFDRDAFREWSEKNEMFQIRDYELGRVQTEGSIGWTEVRYDTTLRRYPNLEPRTAHQWQKWRRVANAWYPIPQDELDEYPEAPALRDLDEEKRLRARFEASWEARLGRHWDQLYYLTDPRDYDAIDPDEYAEVEGLFQYLSHKIQWVEVMGDQGEVYVTYHHKLTDESLEKLPPRDAKVMERWIKYNNQWYHDLKR